ncbi:MAG: DUF4394 domain-containing protein [Chthoniobacteraceae bacterium]
MKLHILFLIAGVTLLGFCGKADAVGITRLTNTNTNAVTLSGITGGDAVVGIDYRPIDGLLIGPGYNSATGTARVYSITAAGVATSINGNTLTLGTGLARVTADFNPFANAIRIVTSGAGGANSTAFGNNNFRIGTGGTGALVTAAGDLNPANTGIRATAYSCNNAGGGTSGATTLMKLTALTMCS